MELDSLTFGWFIGRCEESDKRCYEALKNNIDVWNNMLDMRYAIILNGVGDEEIEHSEDGKITTLRFRMYDEEYLDIWGCKKSNDRLKEALLNLTNFLVGSKKEHTRTEDDELIDGSYFDKEDNEYKVKYYIIKVEIKEVE